MNVTRDSKNELEVTFPSAPYDNGGRVVTYVKLSKEEAEKMAARLNFDFGWMGYEFYTNTKSGVHYCTLK